jgi:hypothetical protein
MMIHAPQQLGKGGRLEQPPAAMLEISRRHSVMLHRSCIPSFEIERATMSRPGRPVARSLHGLVRKFLKQKLN